jgi:hypothetical protein
MSDGRLCLAESVEIGGHAEKFEDHSRAIDRTSSSLSLHVGRYVASSSAILALLGPRPENLIGFAGTASHLRPCRPGLLV